MGSTHKRTIGIGMFESTWAIINAIRSAYTNQHNRSHVPLSLSTFHLMPRAGLMALFAALVLGDSLSAYAASHLSRDPQVNHARQLIETNQPQAALALLRPLNTPERNDITDIRFLIGLAAIAAAKMTIANTPNTERITPTAQHLLNAAITALRAILINQPGLIRVRLELARAFFISGNDNLATQHFNLVLAGDIRPPMVANINRFLSVIRARKLVSGYFSMNIGKNDNLNAGSDVKTAYVSLFGQRLPFTFTDTAPRSASGLIFAGGLEYQAPLGADKRWQSNLDWQREDYAGHADDHDYLQLASGPRFLLSRQSEVGVQALSGRRWIGANRYSRDYGVNISAKHAANRKTRLHAIMEWRKTRVSTNAALNNAESKGRLGGDYLFSQLVQGYWQIGYGIVRRLDRVRRRDRSGLLGVSVLLPRGFTLGGNYTLLRQRYNRSTRFSTARWHNHRKTTRLLLLNRQITVFGFSPQLSLTHTRQQSTDLLDQYQRTIYGLRLIRQF